MDIDIESLITDAKNELATINELDQLEVCRVKYLGKKGLLTDILKSLGRLPAETRPIIGGKVNQAKSEILAILTEKQSILKNVQLTQKLSSDRIDLSLPGRGESLGSRHPVSQSFSRLQTIFTSLGFNTVTGPEIEDDYHNFEALNFPLNHPARAMQDTFYLENGSLLRTHTSSVQIRAMKNAEPPFRMITPGRVYRHDSDQTHTPMFHQLEGLWVDETVTFSDLKSMVEAFLQAFFNTKLTLRFRPSYFPFTEPSAEVDIKMPGNTEWLEVLGCGMVHPNVLSNMSIDNEKYTGYAFGIGVDRLSMLYYGVKDLRNFFTNDMDFLGQF